MAILRLVRKIVRWSMVLGGSHGVMVSWRGEGYPFSKDTLNLSDGQSDSATASFSICFTLDDFRLTVLELYFIRARSGLINGNQIPE